MNYKDPNKEHREYQRRILKREGWVAVPALKKNGSRVWKWIIAGRKKAYSREEAFDKASKSLRRKGIYV